MKSLILIAVLAALTVCYAASVLPQYEEETIYAEEIGQSFTKDYYLDGATARNIDDEDRILFYE